MLAAFDLQLCGCAAVLKAKSAKLPATMEALWELEDWTTEQINKAYQRALGGAVEATRRRSLTSKGAAKAELARLDAVARAFGRSPGLEKLITEQNRMAFALGALYIRQRDAEIRKTHKLPPMAEGASLRVEVEPREVEKASSSPASKISAGFEFSLVNKKALEQLDKQALLWFRDIDGLGYADPKARAAILLHAEQQIAAGKSGYAVAASMADKAESIYGVGKFKGKGLTYWGGVSENAATVAAVRGEILELAAFGWDRYEIVNPMDERTTPICSMLNGKTVLVPNAIEAMTKEAGATSINELKAAKPWSSGGSGKEVTAATGKLSAGPQNLSAKQSDALGKAGFAYPPYHFRCRSYIDIAYVDGGGVPTPISEAAKVPKVPKAPSVLEVAAPVAPTPTPKKPQPKPKAPAPTAPAFEAAPGEFPFPIDECKWHPMKLGGQNPKFVIEAPDGSLWMYKDYTQITAPYRKHVDVLAARISQAAGMETPATYAIDIPRKWKGWGPRQTERKTTGSISKLYNKKDVAAFDVGGGVGGMPIEGLGNAAVLDVQTDHAINWLISNGDGHYENFIRMNNGKVVGIDKGQGFKFFGRDKLKIDYVSPQPPMPATNGLAYAESQLTRYANGQTAATKPKFNFMGVTDEAGELTGFGKRLKAMEDMDDAAYKATIKPYFEAMHKQGRGIFQSPGMRGASVDDALNAVVKRKNSMIADFDELYKGIEKQRSAALGIQNSPTSTVRLTKEGKMLAKRNLWKEESAEIFKTVAKEKMAGQSIFTGGHAFEDMTLHGMRYRTMGRETARRHGLAEFQWQFKGRLRPGASKNLASRLENLSTGRPMGARSVGAVKTDAELVREAQGRIESMWEGGMGKPGVERFVKSFNYRFNPGAGGFGNPMGAYTRAYDDMLKEFDALAKLKQTNQRRAAAKKLGYIPTSAEVNAATKYAQILRKYKTADGEWNAANIVSKIGQTNRVPTGKIRLTKEAGADVVPKGTPKATFEPKVTRVQGAQPIEALQQVNLRGAASEREAINLTEVWNTQAQKKFVNGKKYSADRLEDTMYQIHHPTNASVEIRFTPHSESGRSGITQNKGDFRLIFNKKTPTAKDVADAKKLVEHLGIPLSAEGATIEEMKVLWARKQARSIGLDLDISTKRLFSAVDESLSAAEQLKGLERAFTQAAAKTGNSRLRWNTLTNGMKDADYMPVFHETSRGVGGRPQWIRNDVTAEGFMKEKTYGLRSKVTGDGHEAIFESMATSGDLSMKATAGRARGGTNWWDGMSPIADMESGGANYVFTRMNKTFNQRAMGRNLKSGKFNPNTQSVTASEGIYYKPRTMTYSDNIYYPTDEYGRVSSQQFIGDNMVKTVDAKDPYLAYKRGMVSTDNEVILKHSIGMGEDVDFWVVETNRQRRRMLALAEENGVKTLGGKPVEQFFLSRGR